MKWKTYENSKGNIIGILGSQVISFARDITFKYEKETKKKQFNIFFKKKGFKKNNEKLKI